MRDMPLGLQQRRSRLHRVTIEVLKSACGDIRIEYRDDRVGAEKLRSNEPNSPVQRSALKKES